MTLYIVFIFAVWKSQHFYAIIHITVRGDSYENRTN